MANSIIPPIAIQHINLNTLILTDNKDLTCKLFINKYKSSGQIIFKCDENHVL